MASLHEQIYSKRRGSVEDGETGRKDRSAACAVVISCSTSVLLRLLAGNVGKHILHKAQAGLFGWSVGRLGRWSAVFQ